MFQNRIFVFGYIMYNINYAVHQSNSYIGGVLAEVRFSDAVGKNYLGNCLETNRELAKIFTMKMWGIYSAVVVIETTAIEDILLSLSHFSPIFC